MTKECAPRCDVKDAVKDDEGKLCYDLIPTYPLQELVKVYTVGAQKYGRHNWRKGMQWSRVYAAIQRHLNAFWSGQDCDTEDGLPHLAHAAWGCMTLIEYMDQGLGVNDREIRGQEVDDSWSSQ